MNSEDLDNAKEVLYAFMREMNSWEKKCHLLYQGAAYGAEQHGPAALQELKVIYEKYLTAKDRKTGRLSGPNVGYPPEFDPAQEEITSSNLDGIRAVFETLWIDPFDSDFTERHRFILVRGSGGWLLDRKERFSILKNKWVAHQF